MVMTEYQIEKAIEMGFSFHDIADEMQMELELPFGANENFWEVE